MMCSIMRLFLFSGARNERFDTCVAAAVSRMRLQFIQRLRRRLFFEQFAIRNQDGMRSKETS